MTEQLLPCTKCGKTKRESEFPVDKRMTGRLQRSSWCMNCHKRANREFYHKNKDGHRPKQKFYRIDADRVEVH